MLKPSQPAVKETQDRGATRKQDIMRALAAFVAQRPGLEYSNYGDPQSYRAEMRSITRDRHDYDSLAAAVAASSAPAYSAAGLTEPLQ